MIYRGYKGQKNGIWHFNSECRLWPQYDYIEVVASVMQRKGSVCGECIELEWP